MSAVAVAIAGGAIIGGVVASDNASTAADAQVQSAQLANQTQSNMFNQQQANLQPWKQSGQMSLADLNNLMFNADGSTNMSSILNQPFTAAQYHQSPGYQFQMQQGIDAIQNSAAAKGLTGNTLRELMSYGQGVANQDYWNAYNAYTQNQNNIFGRLNTMSGTGANAAGGIANLGMNTANNISNNLIGAGNATAAGIVGSANALSGGANSAIQNYMLYNMMQNQQANQSSVPAWAINQANASSDPIASLNSSMGWTGGG